MNFNGEVWESIVSEAVECHNKQRTKVFSTVTCLACIIMYLYRFNINCSRLVDLTTVLDLQQEFGRITNLFGDTLEESHTLPSVNQSMIVGQGQVHHRTGDNLSGGRVHHGTHCCVCECER